jgi:hypothetical protein
MTTAMMNPAAGDTASGARKALLRGEPSDHSATGLVGHPVPVRFSEGSQ